MTKSGPPKPHPQVFARDWLDRLLAGSFHPGATDLDELVKICGDDEGLYHEFKPGADPSSGARLDAADILRKYVAGFANSDGGFVVFGYYQKQRVFDGFKASGGGKLIEWATRAIQQLAANLSPPPRILAVPYPLTAGQLVEILIVAVRRAPALVPIIRGGRPQFYFRMGDSTVEVPTYHTIGVPEYLIADVLLGRRQRPWLLPSAPTFTVELKHDRRLGGNVYAHEATIGVTLENQSLVFAEAVTAGIVSWSLDLQQIPPARPKRASSTEALMLEPISLIRPSMDAPDFTRRRPAPVPQSLHAYIEVAPPEPNTREQWRDPWRTVHAPAWRGLRELDLPPFAVTELTFGRLVLPVFECTEEREVPPEDELERHHWALRRGRVRLQMALYVVARAGEPQWFDVDIVYGHEALPRAAEELKSPSRRANLTLRRCTAERARVGMEIEKNAISWGP